MNLSIISYQLKMTKKIYRFSLKMSSQKKLKISLWDNVYDNNVKIFLIALKPHSV